MTFLLSEDKALRDKLIGMTVTDQKAAESVETTRKVGVWFGQPDQEIRTQSYPYVTIDMIDIAIDPTREHRGYVKPSYIADPATIGSSTYNPAVHDWYIHYPIPVNIDYQITTYARQPRHDREIIAQVLYSKIPMRFAALEVDDGTIRRLDILDVIKRDVTESGKRLFVNIIRVRVSSEIVPEAFTKVYKALQVQVTGTAGPARVAGNYPFTPIDSYTQTAP